ncbi:antA/AntB antirepressor family protein, partial [Lentilactobacillus buchneri]
FTENVDFAGFEQKSTKPQGGRPQVNHALTLDMAKELSMIQRTDRGKQARQYFIAMEKRAKAKQQLPQTPEEK